MRRLNFIPLLLMCLSTLSAQTYTYRQCLKDWGLESKLHRHRANNHIDSLKAELGQYKNRLGFSYYQFKALVANFENDSNQIRYLDSAFACGLTPLCLGKQRTQFDSAALVRSYKNNYLKSYDSKLILTIDSMRYLDQYYRKQMVTFSDVQSLNKPKKTEEEVLDNFSAITPPTRIVDRKKDSLEKLQRVIDSTNFILLNKIIKSSGWPAASKIGERYCQRRAPDVTILIAHMDSGTKAFQIENLTRVIELCKNNEESWAVAEKLLAHIHARWKNDFSEFTFLTITGNRINREESYFSLIQMATVLMKKPYNKMVIKCNNVGLFQQLVRAMTEVSHDVDINKAWLMTYSEMGWPAPKRLVNSDFIFVLSRDSDNDVIHYKFVAK